MADEIISRDDARAQGLKRYFTGKPCKRGHIACRFVANNYCVLCCRITEWTRRGTTEASAKRRREASLARAQARQRGALRYFTGIPCKHGHVAEREVSNGRCLECARIKQATRYQNDPEKYRAAAKKYLTLHGGEVRERRRKQYQLNSDKERERSREYQLSLSPDTRKQRRRNHYEKYRDKNIEYRRNYRAQNREKVLEQQRRYGRSESAKAGVRKYREANRDRINQSARQKRSADPETRRASYRKWAAKEESEAVIKANAHRRRARILKSPGEHNPSDLREILRMQNYRCAHPGCGADLRKVGKHLDHIMPLALGGSNDRRNLQYLCPTHNLSKGALDPIEFARRHGRLL